MPSGPFSKQAVWKTTQLNGNYAGDTVIGGAVNTAPSGLTASQFQQTQPGDRILLSPSDALINSNNTTGNLYTGSYRYVATQNNSSANIARGHAMFWQCNNATGAATSAQDGLYQTTADEPANHTAMFAGVAINNATKGNYWWIQESGKTTCWFRNAITGTPTVGAGVYLAIAGNNNNAIDVGAFDQLTGANSAAIFTANSTTAYTTVDQMISRYVGVAEGLPANNNSALVDITLSRASFRF
jgi:hypothetical protein